MLKKELQELKNGLDPDELQLSKARVTAAQEELYANLAAAENSAIKAPFAGELVRLDAKIGEYVLSGQPVAILADKSAWKIEVDSLTEQDIQAYICWTIRLHQM